MSDEPQTRIEYGHDVRGLAHQPTGIDWVPEYRGIKYATHQRTGHFTVEEPVGIDHWTYADHRHPVEGCTFCADLAAQGKKPLTTNDAVELLLAPTSAHVRPTPQADRRRAELERLGVLHHDTSDQPHCTTCTCGRRAPVQSSRNGGTRHGITYSPHGPGTIAWSEHEEAWAVYGSQYGQSAERIAERGGFGYGELVDFLKREPTTWRAAR